MEGSYLEGQGDFISRLINLITHIVSPLIPIVNLLTESPLKVSFLERRIRFREG